MNLQNLRKKNYKTKVSDSSTNNIHGWKKIGTFDSTTFMNREYTLRDLEEELAEPKPIKVTTTDTLVKIETDDYGLRYQKDGSVYQRGSIDSELGKAIGPYALGYPAELFDSLRSFLKPFPKVETEYARQYRKSKEQYEKDENEYLSERRAEIKRAMAAGEEW